MSTKELSYALHATNAISRRLAAVIIEDRPQQAAAVANAFRFAATDMQFSEADELTRNLLRDFQQGLHAFADQIDPYLARE